MDSIQRYFDLDGGSSNDVAVSSFQYDATGRLSQIDHRLGSTPGSGTQPAGYGYTWDDANRLTDVDFLPSAVRRRRRQLWVR